jgi:uncharacterized membrane protein YecN with MAPEG domain
VKSRAGSPVDALRGGLRYTFGRPRRTVAAGACEEDRVALVSIVALLALIEYSVFVILAGQARGRFGVPAPATTGHPIFERYLRVQQNTVEQLVIFLPALFVFARFASEAWAAALGVVFIVGRALYARGYILDPAKRGPGFLLTMTSNTLLILGGIVGAVLEHA